MSSSKDIEAVMEMDGVEGKFDVKFSYHPPGSENSFFSFRLKSGLTKRKKNKDKHNLKQEPNINMSLANDPVIVINPDGTRRLNLGDIVRVIKGDTKTLFIVETIDERFFGFTAKKGHTRNTWVDTITQCLNEFKQTNRKGKSTNNLSASFSATAEFGSLAKTASKTGYSSSTMGAYDAYRNPNIDRSMSRIKGSRKNQTMNRNKERNKQNHRQSVKEQNLVRDTTLQHHRREMQEEEKLDVKERELKHLGLSEIPPPPPPPNMAARMLLDKGSSPKRSVLRTFINNGPMKTGDATVDISLSAGEGVRNMMVPMLKDEVTVKNREKSLQTISFLRETWMNNPSIKKVLTQRLDDKAKELMIEKMYKVVKSAGEMIVNAGGKMNDFYIVEEGKFLRFIPSVGVTSNVPGGRGANFGEMQLRYNTKSTFSLKCTTDCVFWALSKNDYTEVLSDFGMRLQAWRLEALKAIPAFTKHISSQGLKDLASTLDIHFRKENEVLVDYGEKMTKMIFVFQGEVRIFVKNSEKPRGKLIPKGNFGLLALFEEVISEFKVVTANSKTVYFVLQVAEFEQLFGSMKDVISKSVNPDLTSDMKKITVIKKRTKLKLKSPLEQLQTQIDRARKTMNVLQEDGYGSDPDDVPTITDSFFNDDDTGSITTLSDREEDDGEEDFDDAPALLPNITFNDIDVLEMLNQGSFGVVYLARCNKGENSAPLSLGPGEWAGYAPASLALKVMSRYYIQTNGWDGKVDNEVAAMSEVSSYCASPFILQLYHSFACPKFVYLLMEYGEGGDLYHLLMGQKGSYLEESSARYYIASVVNGMEVLHQRKIMYRDLKPENLILNRLGHLKVADLGLAKKTARTKTQCGTPDYTAPEVLRGNYNHACDWWAVGVLVFELHYGQTPFFARDVEKIYRQIEAHRSPIMFYDPKNRAPRIEGHGYLAGKERFSNECKDLISRFLVPKPALRLGHMAPGASAVRNHPYFRRFNWQKFQKLELIPPFALGGNLETIDEIIPADDLKWPSQNKTDRSHWVPRVDSHVDRTPRIK